MGILVRKKNIRSFICCAINVHPWQHHTSTHTEVLRSGSVFCCHHARYVVVLLMHWQDNLWSMHAQLVEFWVAFCKRWTSACSNCWRLIYKNVVHVHAWGRKKGKQQQQQYEVLTVWLRIPLYATVSYKSTISCCIWHSSWCHCAWLETSLKQNLLRTLFTESLNRST